MSHTVTNVTVFLILSMRATNLCDDIFFLHPPSMEKG